MVMYRLEIGDYAIEGDREIILDTLYWHTPEELAEARLYRFMKKDLLWFSVNLKIADDGRLAYFRLINHEAKLREEEEGNVED